MAFQPDYTTGTITLTGGSVNFTTSGAALQTAQVQAGDQILLPLKGSILTIASITGENSGTLTNNCPAGDAGAAQVYRIRYQSDLSRVNAQLVNLINLLGNGKLASLAGVAGAADKLPYFTGANTLAVTDLPAAARSLLGLTAAADKIAFYNGPNTAFLIDLTAFARQILDDANAAAVLTTLGIPVEIGTWTPTLIWSGGNGTWSPTYTTRVGNYMRFGRLWIIEVALGFNSNNYSGASGGLQITGGPSVGVNPATSGQSGVSWRRVSFIGYPADTTINGDYAASGILTPRMQRPSLNGGAAIGTSMIPVSTAGFELIGSTQFINAT